MARYVHDYQGMVGDPRDARGMDPNYRGRYRGMRMGGDPGQGAYGRYRQRHERELEGSGGFAGRTPAYDRGYGRDPRSIYDWEMRGGGLRNARYDREFLRGFNANTPAYRREGRWQGRYGADYGERGGRPIPGDDRYRFGYANRGLGSGGFSEAWQHRPAHGSR